jgi:hypothetical protein
LPLCYASLEKELGDFKDAAQYVMDLYVLEEEGTERKGLIERLDEAEHRVRDQLLDTAKLVAAVALSMVKYHEPSYDLQKVTEDVDLSGLVRQKRLSASSTFESKRSSCIIL